MFSMFFMVAALAQSVPAVAPAPVEMAQVRQAVEKSLPFLEKHGREWETTKCVSCHHGPWMLWSGYEAKKHGFIVNDLSLEKVRAADLKAYGSHPTLQPTNRDILHPLSINTIYLMFAMGAAGEPDGETAAFYDRVAAHLLEQQHEDGSWRIKVKTKTFEGLMAPLIDQDDVTTLWALLALNYREPAWISKEALESSKTRGLKFLRDNPQGDTLQTVVLRIMLSKRLGNMQELQARIKELLAMQKPDGGWSQTTKLRDPDSLGTGQALFALTTAGLTGKDPSVAKGVAYLVRTQKPDGSWDVTSCAYEPPKFCSYVGTAWATMAMVSTLPETKDAVGAASP